MIHGSRGALMIFSMQNIPILHCEEAANKTKLCGHTTTTTTTTTTIVHSKRGHPVGLAENYRDRKVDIYHGVAPKLDNTRFLRVEGGAVDRGRLIAKTLKAEIETLAKERRALYSEDLTPNRRIFTLAII